MAKLLVVAFITLLAKGIETTTTRQAPFFIDSPASWIALPHIDATDHLIFQAASGLLQHWSNTAYPNGHSLSPGTIPVGTVMYHGSPTGVPSLTPDWTSFDSEHAILFARGEKGALLAFTVTRPLKVSHCFRIALRIVDTDLKRSFTSMAIAVPRRSMGPWTHSILSRSARS